MEKTDKQYGGRSFLLLLIPKFSVDFLLDFGWNSRDLILEGVEFEKNWHQKSKIN